MNGAAAVAMLIGPDAPLTILPERYSYFEDESDFFKPTTLKAHHHPVMPKGGQHSVACYEKALVHCYSGLKTVLGGVNLVEQCDFIAAHSTSVYLIKRAFRSLVDTEYGVGSSNPSNSVSLAKRNEWFSAKVDPSTHACKLVGSMYTAAVYVNLASLLATVGPASIGKTVLVYSYGSGLSASLFRIKVRSQPSLNDFFEEQLSLKNVTLVDPNEFIRICGEFSDAIPEVDFVPRAPSPLKTDMYFLEKVDAHGLRHYAFSG